VRRNLRRVESLARAGHVFRNIFDVHLHWRREVLLFLKSRSRVLALVDYAAEKSLIMNVPHRMLLGEEEQVEALPREPTPRPNRTRRSRDCPF
jgi:hypothetical protein